MQTRDYKALLLNVEGGVATLTLNRPERKNALNPQLVNELLWALDDAKAAPDVKVVVLAGAGGTFCAGGDLKQMSEPSTLEMKGDYSDLLLRFPALGLPTLARVDGYAMGGGLGLVASCDFAVGAESAQLGTPEIKRGLFPMMIMAVLDRVMSRRDLMNLMLLGDRIEAKRAASLRLLSEVVPDEQLDARTEELAATLAGRSPTAMKRGLLAYHAQHGVEPEQSIPALRSELYSLLGTKDAREGLQAFAEKREPVWTGE